MDRRAFHRLAALAIAARSGIAWPQPAGRVFRIGFLTNFVPLATLELGLRSSDRVVAAVVQGLRDLGWEEGRNIRIVWRSAEGDFARHPRLVEELVRMPVDVIVAFGEGVDAAAAATRTIPIVSGFYFYPVDRGLVKSLARPGRNITGIATSVNPEDLQKSVALLKQAAPRISRVCLVSRSKGPSADRTPDPKDLPRIKAAGAALGLDFIWLTYGDAHTIDQVVRSAVRQGAHAIISDGNYSLYHPRAAQQKLEDAAIKHRLPIMHLWLPAAENGGLLAHAGDNSARWRRIPSFVDRILKGQDPAAMPIEQVGNVEFHINLKAAKAIGLEIPQAVLLQADKVYE